MYEIGGKMPKEPLIEVSLPSLDACQAVRAICNAIDRIAETDPQFKELIFDHRVHYIVDSPPGTIRLPRVDAEKLSAELRDFGVVLKPVDKATSLADRNKARSYFLRQLFKK